MCRGPCRSPEPARFRARGGNPGPPFPSLPRQGSRSRGTALRSCPTRGSFGPGNSEPSLLPGRAGRPAVAWPPATARQRDKNGGGARGRTVRGEFATQRAGWRTRFAVVTPCSPSTCVACWGRVRHFATLSAVRNCPLLAPRPEIIPQRANLPGVSGFSARLPQSASSGDFGTPPDDQKKVTNNRQPVLFPAEQQVEHPATTDVRPGAAAVR